MTAKKTIDYQTKSGELDKILAELGSGELDIDEAVRKYDLGMTLVEELTNYLKLAENKIKKVK